MKNIVIYISVFLTAWFGNNTFAQIVINQGLYRSNIGFYSFALYGETVREYENERNYLFKDSCLIFERQIWMPSIGVNFDKYPLNKYVTLKYTFLNLHTGKAQDYDSLTDTAAPVFNYTIRDSVAIGPFFGKLNNFTAQKNIKKYSIRDTSFLGANYKILECIYSYNPTFENVAKYIYSCNSPVPANIINPEEFKNCLCVRVYNAGIKPFIPEQLSSVNQLIRPFLTPQEEEIFSKWTENSKITMLPLSNETEASRQPSPLRDQYINKTLEGWGLYKANN